LPDDPMNVILYNCWYHMQERCYSESNKSYPDYGGRGIKVCERWLNSFKDFCQDVGSRPVGMTLDRKDNNGNYGPDNFRWATRKTQSQNRSNVILVGYNGVVKCLASWGEEYGISGHVLNRRINKRKWSFERALTTPIQPQAFPVNSGTRQNQILELNGERKTLLEWSREIGIPYKKLRGRLILGWDDRRTLTTPFNANTVMEVKQ